MLDAFYEPCIMSQCVTIGVSPCVIIGVSHCSTQLHHSIINCSNIKTSSARSHPHPQVSCA